MSNNCCVEHCSYSIDSRCIDCKEDFCFEHSKNHLIYNNDHKFESILVGVFPKEKSMIDEYIDKQKSILLKSKEDIRAGFKKILKKTKNKMNSLIKECENCIKQISDDKITLKKSSEMSARLYQNYHANKICTYKMNLTLFED